MKKLLLNKLVIKKVETSSNFLNNHLYSICDFCKCKFHFFSNNLNIHKQADEKIIFCSFCLRHNHKKDSTFLFSFSKVFEIISIQNKKEIKTIIKNIYFIGNSYPFLAYNPESDYWAINVSHISLCENKKELILKFINEMFDVFKSLNNHLYLNLKHFKKELIEEIEMFIETKSSKNKIFLGSNFF